MSGNKYLAVSGQATVKNDRAKIKELWNPFAKAWWKSPDDPVIRVVTLTPEEAELWDSPNKLVATAVMLTAAATVTSDRRSATRRTSTCDAPLGS